MSKGKVIKEEELVELATIRNAIRRAVHLYIKNNNNCFDQEVNLENIFKQLNNIQSFIERLSE